MKVPFVAMACLLRPHSYRGNQPGHASSSTVNRRCSALLTPILCVWVAALAKTCPPGFFDYGPPCPDHAAQVVLCHHGADAPILPDPGECARAAHDMALIGLTFVVTCGYEPKEILIRTSAPADPELLCLNLHFQAEFSPLGFDDWWIVRFPHPINVLAMVATYQALPAVLGASVNGLGSVDGCYDELNYIPLPNGTWHWIYDYPVPFHSSCRQVIWRAFVTQSGIVIPPGDLTCDGVVGVSDVSPFVEAILGVTTFSGCDPFPADVNGDGEMNGADIQSFVHLLNI